jgi:hypothetical protein
LVIDTAGIAVSARWIVISPTPSPQLVGEPEGAKTVRMTASLLGYKSPTQEAA